MRRSGTTYQWRLWFNGQTTSYVLDIQQNVGQFILYTQEYKDPITEEPSQRIFSKSDVLSTEQVKSINSLRDTMSNRMIPTDKQIKGWGDMMGLDGVTYIIEAASKDSYSFESYWSPASIDVDEARRLKRFIEVAEQSTAYQSLHKELHHLFLLEAITLRPMIAVKITTVEGVRKLRKQRKAYRKLNSKPKAQSEQTP